VGGGGDVGGSRASCDSGEGSVSTSSIWLARPEIGDALVEGGEATTLVSNVVGGFGGSPLGPVAAICDFVAGSPGGEV